MESQQNINQTQQNLLLHLETNRHFIQQKVYDEFKMECLQEKQLKDLDTSKLKKVILQIFDFGQSIEMKQFYATISGNIGKFVAQIYRKKQKQDDFVTDIEKLYDMINYCVMKGFPEKPKQSIIKKQVQQEIQVERIQPKKIQIKKQQPKKIIIKKPKTPQKVFQLPKYDMPDTNVGPRYLQNNIKKQQKQKVNEYDTIEVQTIDKKFVETHQKSMKQKLKKIYIHYCTQQQNIGVNATFDRIKQECQHMNFGKWIMFCQQTHLFDPKILKRDKLMIYFRKIAPSQPSIGFEQFQQILKLADQFYVSQKKKINGLDNFPTYQARLCLNSQKYKDFMNDVDLPFSVREKQGRQLQQYSIQSPKAQRIKQRQRKVDSSTISVSQKSNRHSLDMKTIMNKNKQYLNNLIVKRKGNPQQLNASQIISLNTLQNHKLPKIDWMIIKQDQSDNLYLSDYKLDIKLKDTGRKSYFGKPNKDIAKAVKQRVNQVEKFQKQKRYQSINY